MVIDTRKTTETTFPGGTIVVHRETTKAAHHPKTVALISMARQAVATTLGIVTKATTTGAQATALIEALATTDQAAAVVTGRQMETKGPNVTFKTIVTNNQTETVWNARRRVNANARSLCLFPVGTLAPASFARDREQLDLSL